MGTGTRKLILLSLIVVLLLFISTIKFAGMPGYAETVLELAVGSGTGEVGYDTTMPERFGPEGLFVTGETINILDSVNKRILVFSSGQLSKSIPIYDVQEARDFVVDAGGTFYVFDAGQSIILAIDKDGKIKKHISVPPHIGEADFRYLSIGKNGRPFLVCAGFEEYDIGTWTKTRGVSNAVDGRVFSLKVRDEKRVTILADNKDIATVTGNGQVREVVIRGVARKGNLYVTNWDLDPDSSRVEGYLTLRRIDRDGNITGFAVLEEPSNPPKVYAPTRSISVTPSGRVYRMVCLEDKVIVQKIHPGSSFGLADLQFPKIEDTSHAGSSY